MFEQVSGFFVPIIILLSLASVSSILISVFKLKFLPTFAVEILIGLVKMCIRDRSRRDAALFD